MSILRVAAFNFDQAEMGGIPMGYRSKVGSELLTESVDLTKFVGPFLRSKYVDAT
jgi:hypothetical protein